jgi:hypothetical protein
LLFEPGVNLTYIWLYREAPAAPSEKIWIEAEAADSITAPMQIFSAIGGASGGQYIAVESGDVAFEAQM